MEALGTILLSEIAGTAMLTASVLSPTSGGGCGGCGSSCGCGGH